MQTWWPQILTFLHTGITNAGSEGTNRVIKTVARNAYGFRNPVNQRLRTRCATTREIRGHLNPRTLRRAIKGTRPAHNTKFGSSNETRATGASCRNLTCEVPLEPHDGAGLLNKT